METYHKCNNWSHVFGNVEIRSLLCNFNLCIFWQVDATGDISIFLAKIIYIYCIKNVYYLKRINEIQNL